MSTLLYVDAVAGVAGDMLLGALLDAGASLEQVRAGLGELGVDGLEVTVKRVQRHGIAAMHACVLTPPEPGHRDWAAVRALIDAARLPTRVHARAQATFRALAEAEGAIHGVSPDRVQFHEVGGVDAIADVCGVALALEDLGVERVVCSPLPMPRGLVTSAHGSLPLPAPATLQLLRGAPVHGVEENVELVTPTGAALVATLAEAFGALPPLTLAAVGYGAGTRELDCRPNVVRVLLGEASAGAAGTATGRRDAVLVECNLDDLPGELIPDALEACWAAGALDAWLTPVQMKKGRPGIVLSALARPEREAALSRALLTVTTTLGIRCVPVTRLELERESRQVWVDGQRVAIKLGRLDGQVVNVSPEHDDVARAAAALGRPVKQVWAAALAATDSWSSA